MYNRYIVTIKGTDDSAGTVNAVQTVIWAAAIYVDPLPQGKEKEYAGGVKNDVPVYRMQYKMRLIPFGYPDGSVEGHDMSLYLSLFAGPLSKSYKFIASVTGLDMVAADGTSGYWATHTNVPVLLTGVDTEEPDDNTKVVTLTFQQRGVGL